MIMLLAQFFGKASSTFFYRSSDSLFNKFYVAVTEGEFYFTPPNCLA